MRNWKVILAVVGLALLPVIAQAVTVTNADGTTIEVRTLGEAATAALSTRAYIDQSTYAHQSARAGTIVRFYDSSIHGTNAATAIDLTGIYGTGGAADDTELNNAVIYGGIIQVINPNATTNTSVGVESAADLVAVDAGIFDTTGIKAITPVWTAASAVGPVTSGNEIDITIGTGDTVTNLMWIGVFDYYLMQ